MYSDIQTKKQKLKSLKDKKQKLKLIWGWVKDKSNNITLKEFTELMDEVK